MGDTNLSSLRIGDAGQAPDTRAGQVPSGAVGALTSPIYVYDVVPAAASLSAIAANATVSGGAWTVSAGLGTTVTSIGGVSYVDMGCDRNITASGSSTAVLAVTITASGLDSYFQVVTTAFTGPVSTATTSSLKTMRYVRGVATNGNTTSNVSIGAGDVLGFPYRVDSSGFARMSWNGDLITTSLGFSGADVTSPATSATGDVRGTQTLPNQVSNGVRRFTAFIFVRDPNTVTGLYGVKQV